MATPPLQENEQPLSPPSVDQLTRTMTAARTAGQLADLTAETRDISVVHRNEVVYIRNCSKCNFTINGPCMKIIIEGITATTVVINASALTGMCEIISSKDFTLAFNIQYPIVTIDNSINGTLLVQQDKPQDFIWSRCEGLRLSSNKVHEIPTAQTLRPDVSPDTAQFKTKWTGRFATTELLIREGAGYVTTEREKKFNDDRDERNKVLFDMAMGVKFKAKQ